MRRLFLSVDKPGSDRQTLHTADDHHYFPFNFQRFIFTDHDRLHGRVGGLEAVIVFFFIESRCNSKLRYRVPDSSVLEKTTSFLEKIFATQNVSERDRK